MSSVSYTHLDLPGFAQAHKAVARPSLPVTGCAEGWDKAHVHQPMHHLVQGALVGNVELFRIMRAFFLRISADRGAGRAADLGNTRPERAFPNLL